MCQSNQKMCLRIRPSILKQSQSRWVSSLNAQMGWEVERDGQIPESLPLQCLLALPAASYWSHITITGAIIHKVMDSPNFSSIWYQGVWLEQRAVFYLFTPSLNSLLDLQPYDERELGFTTRRVWWKRSPFESLSTAAPSAESCVWFIPPLSHVSCCIMNSAWVREEEETMRD